MREARLVPTRRAHITHIGVAVLSVVLSCGGIVGLRAAAQAGGPPQDGARRTADAPKGRVFASDAGVVLNFVKPDKTAEFEGVMVKLRTALQASDKPERKQQAAGWKIFKAAEPGPSGSVLYVFSIDPAVKGVDYTVSTILAEAFPSEAQTLYKQYAESYATGQNIVNLTLVAALGQ